MLKEIKIDLYDTTDKDGNKYILQVKTASSTVGREQSFVQLDSNTDYFTYNINYLTSTP